SLGAPPIFKESLNLLWLGPRRTVASAGSVKWLAVVMRNAKCPLHSPAPSWGKKAVLPAQLERIARGIPVQTERGVAKDKHCAGARDDPRGTSQDRKRRATERLTADETRLTEERHVQTNAVEHGSQRPWRDEGAWRWAATNCPSPPVLQNAPSRPAKGRRGGGHANFEQGGDRKEGGNTHGKGRRRTEGQTKSTASAGRDLHRAPLPPPGAALAGGCQKRPWPASDQATDTCRCIRRGGGHCGSCCRSSCHRGHLGREGASVVAIRREVACRGFLGQNGGTIAVESTAVLPQVVRATALPAGAEAGRGRH
ncbi:unnamed protein product, partial [Prorocentrum cordatum]